MKFYLEKPGIRRKEQALSYLEEHQKACSNINGTGGMDHCLNDITYEQWLDILEKKKDPAYAKARNKCPDETFFLIRETDDKIIGMINIRHQLTEEMLKFGGHIGYGIRPTERRKGYNKINLYLGLIKAKEDFNLDRVMIDCSVDNVGSDKTIRALGGQLERCETDPGDHTLTNVYWIDVADSIIRYRDTYAQYISDIPLKTDADVNAI